MANVQTLRKTLSSLCAILLLVCVFLSFMPHEHGCCELHCPICGFLNQLGALALLIAVAAAAVFLQADTWVWTFSSHGRAHVTLVALKVKLSN